MVKGRVARKEPTAWDTACHITNTVLEVAKVTLLLTSRLDDMWGMPMRPSTVIYRTNAVGWTENACACAAHCPLHLHPIDHSAWHDHDRWVSQPPCSDLIWCRLFSDLMQE